MSGITLHEPDASPVTATRQEPPLAGWLGSISTWRLGKLGYSLADQVLSVGGMFVVNIALARVRTKEEYGIFALSYSIFTFLAGLHNAAILEAYTIYGSGRYHDRFAKYRKLLWRCNAWLLSGLTAILLAIWLLLRWLHPAFASPALLGLALACGALLTAAFVRRSFYIERRPDLALRFSATFFVACLVLLAAAVRADWLNGLSAFAIVALAWCVAGFVTVGQRRTSISSTETEDFLANEPGYWSEHWKYSRWVFVTALVFQFTTQAYFWVVAAFLSVKDVAELRAMYNLALPVDQIFAAITLLVLPQMAFQFAARDMSKLRHLWRQCSLMFLGISSLFAMIVGLGSLPLLHLVYGGKFDDLALLLRWYVLLPVVMGIGNASNAALKAVEKPQAVFYAYVASGAATFLLGVPLVMRLGLRGAVFGILLSSSTYTLIMAALWVRSYRQQTDTMPRELKSWRVAIVEPAWTHYRYPVYRDLAQHCRVDWIFSPTGHASGFGKVIPSEASTLRYREAAILKPFGKRGGFWQVGVARYMIRERPDVVMFSANPRSISFWTALVIGHIIRIPVYAHGHGVHGKTHLSFLYRQMMSQLLRLSAGYIAYSPAVRDAFAAHGFDLQKVHVAHNSIVNPCPLSPDEKTGSERGVLFLGRLRPDSGIETLLTAVEHLRERGCDMQLHIIGDGQGRSRLQEMCRNVDWVRWYGEVYDPARIQTISRACLVGCHPGHAGLSVVHMMSLSLPVIIQDKLAAHGPEAALVHNWVNGVRCSPSGQGISLGEALAAIMQDSAKARNMQSNAYRSWLELTTPSLATQLGQVLLQRPYRPVDTAFQDLGMAPLSALPPHAADAPAE